MVTTHPPPCIQGWTIRPFPGLENFVPAVAYQFCLNLSAALSQPGNGLKMKPCSKEKGRKITHWLEEETSTKREGRRGRSGSSAHRSEGGRGSIHGPQRDRGREGDSLKGGRGLTDCSSGCRTGN